MFDIIRSFIRPYTCNVNEINRILWVHLVCVCACLCGVCLRVIPSQPSDPSSKMWVEMSSHTQIPTTIIIELTFIYITAFILGSLIFFVTEKNAHTPHSFECRAKRMPPQWASNSLFDRKQIENFVIFRVDIPHKNILTHSLISNRCFSEFLLSDEWICQSECACLHATANR